LLKPPPFSPKPGRVSARSLLNVRELTTPSPLHRQLSRPDPSPTSSKLGHVWRRRAFGLSVVVVFTVFRVFQYRRPPSTQTVKISCFRTTRSVASSSPCRSLRVRVLLRQVAAYNFSVHRADVKVSLTKYSSLSFEGFVNYIGCAS